MSLNITKNKQQNLHSRVDRNVFFSSNFQRWIKEMHSRDSMNCQNMLCLAPTNEKRGQTYCIAKEKGEILYVKAQEVLSCLGFSLGRFSIYITACL